MDIEKLILSKFTDPTFYINYCKVGRPRTDDNSLTHTIQNSKKLLWWKIDNETLIQKKNEDIGILFDGESYIVQWFFDLRNDNKLSEETLLYYWKGQHAIKGYTPLPSKLEENCPVERIVQWSEPAIFFYSSPNHIVFAGKEDEFDVNASHLLIAQGELSSEIHFCEVPCKKISLRSRASFLLIVPKEKSFFYWHGSQTCQKQRERVVNFRQPHNYLKKWQSGWSNFLTCEQEENKENEIFLNTVQGDHSDFMHIELKSNFSPKLFYLNTITGTFLATEIEYPLRALSEIAPFPFLQSHLYTATQPALFLLDDDKKLWLWEGVTTVNCDNKAIDAELKLAKEMQKKYAEEKERITSQTIKCFHIHAYREPVEFKNIFPFWVEN